LVRERITDKYSDDFLLLVDEPPLLRPCQDRQCWDAYFRVVDVVRRVCRGARHEMVLGDVDGDLVVCTLRRSLKNDISVDYGDW